MMMNLKKLCASLLICSLCACGSVKIKDGEWCGDAGSMGAHCFHTLTDEKRDIPKDQWDEQLVGQDHRFGMVCTQAENFANWKASILKLCSKFKVCTYAFKKQLSDFSEKVDENAVSP